MELYRAVIENNISPNKDGRVQVRIFEFHSDDKEKIKTEHLPWAEVMQSTAFGFSSGVGFSSIPNIGTWVFVTLDHGNPNMPIVIGAISGNSELKSDTSKGFNSPDGVFPLTDRLEEEDQNRLQRVEKLNETIHQTINDTLDIFTKTDSVSGADVSQTEPSSLSDLTKYPDNAVIETKSGHVIEIDDTPGNEKIRLYHSSGTYKDYRPDGSIVDRVMNNINENIKGYVHTHIEKSVKMYIEENLDEIIDGSVKRNIGKTLDEHIVGNVNQTMDKNQTITIKKNLILNVDGNLTWNIKGKCDMNSATEFDLDAPIINLN